jgi:hypothetical protein
VYGADGLQQGASSVCSRGQRLAFIRWLAIAFVGVFPLERAAAANFVLPVLYLVPLGMAAGAVYLGANLIVRGLLFLAFVWVLDGLRSAGRELREDADRDPITGLYNRGAFERLASEALLRARRYQRPLSFAMRGHAQGDRLLATASAVLGGMRRLDAVARLGGEFMLMMPESGHDAATAAVDGFVREWRPS